MDNNIDVALLNSIGNCPDLGEMHCILERYLGRHPSQEGIEEILRAWVRRKDLLWIDLVNYQGILESFHSEGHDFELNYYDQVSPIKTISKKGMDEFHKSVCKLINKQGFNGKSSYPEVLKNILSDKYIAPENFTEILDAFLVLYIVCLFAASMQVSLKLLIQIDFIIILLEHKINFYIGNMWKMRHESDLGVKRKKKGQIGALEQRRKKILEEYNKYETFIKAEIQSRTYKVSLNKVIEVWVDLSETKLPAKNTIRAALKSDKNILKRLGL